MELILVRGLPGAGKSTFAKHLDAFHLEADQFFMKDGEYAFGLAKLREAHEWCLAETRRALKGSAVGAVTNTFTTKKEMKPYLDLAKEAGARVTVLTGEGDHGSVHGVPADVVMRMAMRWESFRRGLL